MGKYKVTTESGTYIVTTDDAPSPPPPPENIEEKKSIGGFIGNIPSSAAGLVYPFLHPIETVKSTNTLLKGTLAQYEETPEGYEPVPGQEQNIETAKAVGNLLVDRYKPSNIANTAYEDPLGVAADVFALTRGGAGLFRKGATASGLTKAAEVAGKVEKVAAAADPLALASKGIIAARGPAAKYVKAILGATTGRGGGSIEEAWKATPSFMERMRGVGNISEVVDDMRQALQNLRNERGRKYRARLEKLKQSGETIDLTNTYGKIIEDFEDFGVKFVPTGNIKDPIRIDMGSLPITNAEKANLNTLMKVAFSWEDMSIAGIDNLKRRIDTFYSDNSRIRALVTKVRGHIRERLSSVEGYNQMTRDYDIATDMIDNFEKELSIGKNTNPGSAVRKVTNLFNQTNDYRTAMVEALNQYSGKKNFFAEIAGEGMSELPPTGIMRPLAAGYLISGIAGAFSPQFLSALVATSPRMVGELAALAGKGSRIIKGIGDKTNAIVLLSPEIYRTGYYATTEERKKREGQ